MSDEVGIGYTLATGRLFCDIGDFHAFAEHVLDRPVWTHEFADMGLWDELRQAFEQSVLTTDENRRDG